MNFANISDEFFRELFALFVHEIMKAFNSSSDDSSISPIRTRTCLYTVYVAPPALSTSPAAILRVDR